MPVVNGTAVFFVQALLAVGAPYLLWRILRLRNLLPLVIVQILVGIALGPSVFGALAPTHWAALFSPSHLTALSGLQVMAVTLFCFLTGLHLRGDRSQEAIARIAIAASAGGIILPLAVGAFSGYALALALPGVVGPQANAIGFGLSVGVCVSVTALPVLGAILREMRLADHRLGRLAIGAAAINDAAVWLLLGAMLVVYRSGATANPIWPIASAVLYGLVCAFVIRPALQWLLDRRDNEPEFQLALALTLVLCSALAAEFIGLHHVMGGFVAGLVWPRRHASDLHRQLEPVTVMALLPFFFLSAGLRSDVSVANGDTLVVFGVTTLIAVISKTTGSAIPAHLAGLRWRDAWALGALLQTKGLVEVVVLAILLDAGVISATAFSGLLLMALVTTVLAKPLTQWALQYPRERQGVARPAGEIENAG